MQKKPKWYKPDLLHIDHSYDDEGQYLNASSVSDSMQGANTALKRMRLPRTRNAFTKVGFPHLSFFYLGLFFLPSRSITSGISALPSIWVKLWRVWFIHLCIVFVTITKPSSHAHACNSGMATLPSSQSNALHWGKSSLVNYNHYVECAVYSCVRERKCKGRKSLKGYQIVAINHTWSA